MIPKLDSNILESQIKEHGVEELLTAIKILLSRALHDSRTQVFCLTYLQPGKCEREGFLGHRKSCANHQNVGGIGKYIRAKQFSFNTTFSIQLDQQHHRSLHRIIPPLFPLFLSKLSDTSARARCISYIQSSNFYVNITSRSVAVKSVAEVIKVTWKVCMQTNCMVVTRTIPKWE